jgi:hypothetical protein
MNEFKFWRWVMRPEQPEIVHVVKDEIPGGIAVQVAENPAHVPLGTPATEANDSKGKEQARGT